MLDSLELPAWIAGILRQIKNSNFANIELLIINGLATGGRPAGLRPGFSSRVLHLLQNKKRRSRILFNAYEKWEKRRYQPGADPFIIHDCTALLGGVERIVVKPVVKGFTHRFQPGDLEAIRSKNLDVIFRFGFNIIRGDILKAARYGVWSYHHGDNDWYRGGPAHFWELVEHNPVSGVLLQVLNEELDGGTVLCKAKVATFPSLSVSANRVRPYWTGSLFAIRKLYELHQYGWEHLQKRSVPNQPVPGRDKIYRAPTNAQMVKFLAPEIIRRSARKAVHREPAISHWKMAIRQDPGRYLSVDKTPDMSGFRWVDEPKGHFYADPFVIERDGSTWVFFEDFLYEKDKGVIACAGIGPDASIEPPVTVLDRPYHTSYPLVFQHDGELFLLPETGGNKAVELYRCICFPDKWKLEKTLLSGVASWDTSLWIEDGRFWFFVGIQHPPDAGLQLYLFHSSSLTGTWESHPANPICSNERMSRGAGALFRDGGALIRPSQDCTVTYGHSFSWNKVTKLTPDDYEETPVLTVLPDWSPGLRGTHTYNRTSRVEVVDGKFRSRLSRHRG